jgi:hypothetical protein
MARQVSANGTAGITEDLIVFFGARERVIFIANDSDTYDLLINFDKGTDESGTFPLKAGEAVNDIATDVSRLYLRGVTGAVAFRALGV